MGTKTVTHVINCICANSKRGTMMSAWSGRWEKVALIKGIPNARLFWLLQMVAATLARISTVVRPTNTVLPKEWGWGEGDDRGLRIT